LIDAQIDLQSIYETYSPIAQDEAGSLTYNPFDVTKVRMTVNGTDQPNGIAYTVDGDGLVTWDAVVSGFHLEPGDQISYYYEYVVT